MHKQLSHKHLNLLPKARERISKKKGSATGDGEGAADAIGEGFGADTGAEERIGKRRKKIRANVERVFLTNSRLKFVASLLKTKKNKGIQI